jgi:5-formyltetrahydrofolate cyclo-ligase
MIEQALALGKRIALPVVNKEEKRIVPVAVSNLQGLVQGAYGIPSPSACNATAVPLKEIDLVVVPGVVFDKKNNRLGRGAGYYDRFLQELPLTTPTVGLAFDIQMVDVIPGLEPHDRPVTQVLTN